MLVVSDVHFAVSALRRVAATGETLLILGDLVNLTDYRTGDGAVADVLGLEFSRHSARARASGDFHEMRRMWSDRVGSEVETVRASIGEALDRQYQEVSDALTGGRGYVIHGNVDRPERLKAALPEGFRYAHGETHDIEGVRFGFVGGGVSTPLRAEGELADEEMRRLLESLGPVDVLCTHVPPDVPPLRRDVITGREERASGPILEYVLDTKPVLHLFGDVHQPQATTWRVGRTRCRNVGYFRATGRPYILEPSMVG